MSKVKIEVFFSKVALSYDHDLKKLLKELKDEYCEAIDIISLQESEKLFNEYHLTKAPAIIVGDIIKMMGVCPSKETMVSALKEVGL